MSKSAGLRPASAVSVARSADRGTTKAASHHINLRVTVAERLELERRRASAGVSGLSQYIRVCLFGREAPLPAVSEPDRVATGARTHCVMVRFTIAELATIEMRRSRTGIAELATYVRRSVLAQRPPRAVVPELNRLAWLELGQQLARLVALGETLVPLAARRPGGLAGLRGRHQRDETVEVWATELRAVREAVQALRRTLLASERGQQ